MNNQLICPNNVESPYDEILHEIDSNILSIKLPKDRHDIPAVDEKVVDKKAVDKKAVDKKAIDEKAKSLIDVKCLDKYGRTCKKGCPKVHVIHNKMTIPKNPEEELLLLKSSKQIIADEMSQSLEVEFKSARNYIPLSNPGPPPSIINPKEFINQKKLENKGKKKQANKNENKNKNNKNNKNKKNKK
ncbi:hypothetical protein ACFW04_002009 [Cataglyphis niger]